MNAEKNIKIYPLYKVLSYDIFFYYAITFFYFTQVKHLTIQEFLTFEALYGLYSIFLIIPAQIIVKKIGIKNSIVFANALWFLGFLGYIFSPNIWCILLSDITFAIGNAIKEITENVLLHSSLKQNNRVEDFNKIEGKGVAMYYYMDTITTIIAGTLYVINPYLPFVCGSVICLISTIVATKFKNIHEKIKVENTNFKLYLKDIKKGMKAVIINKRLQSLILFGAVMGGIIGINSTYYKEYLTNFGMTAGIFTIVYAVFTVSKGISAQFGYLVESKTKNKTLTFISLTYCLTLIILSFITLLNINYSNLLIIASILVFYQFLLEGMYEIANEKYLLNFTNENTATVVLSNYQLIRSVGKSLVMFLGVILIGQVNIILSYIIYGSISLIIMLVIYKFTSTRIGLKPEQYTQKLEI